MGNFDFVLHMMMMAGVISCTYGAIDNFRFLTSGVWSSWKQMEPESVNLIDSATGNTQSFGFIYGGEKLWLISRRYIGTSEKPSIDYLHYASNRGGLISTFDIARNSTWDHRSFKAVNQSASGDILFAAGGRLFMFTFDTSQKQLIYQKLFLWDEAYHDWEEVPLAVEQESMITRGPTDRIVFRLNSADPDGNAVYLVCSAYGESILSKMQIDFGSPITASIKFVARKRQILGQPPPNLVFAAPLIDGDHIRLFDGRPGGLLNSYYTFDARTNRITRGLSTALGSGHLDLDDRIFQDETHLYLILSKRGLHSDADKDNRRSVARINLDTFKSDYGSVQLPGLYPVKFAYRPQQRLLYAMGLQGGVYVANVSEWFVEV